MDKVSDTPRTDASYVCPYGDGLGQWVPREFACELERELAAQKEQFRVLQDEMLVMMDERNAAVAALHVNAGENSRPQD
jgi:hypothetical protein